MLAVGSKRADQAIVKPAFDHLIPVGIRFANADINFLSVAIDGHVAMTGPMMLGPALDEIAIDSENICLISQVHARIRTKYVLSERRDSAMVVLARNLFEVDLG